MGGATVCFATRDLRAKLHEHRQHKKVLRTMPRIVSQIKIAGLLMDTRPNNPLYLEEKDSGVHPWSAEPVKKKPFLWPSGTNLQNLYHR